MVNIKGRAPVLTAVLWVLHSQYSHVCTDVGAGPRKLSLSGSGRCGKLGHTCRHTYMPGEVSTAVWTPPSRSVKACLCTVRHTGTGRSTRPTNVHRSCVNSVCYIHVHVHAGWVHPDTCSWGHSRDRQVLGECAFLCAHNLLLGPPGVQSRPWLGAHETYAPLPSRLGRAWGGDFTFFLDQKLWRWKVFGAPFWLM